MSIATHSMNENKALEKIFEQMRDHLVNLLSLHRQRIRKGTQSEINRKAKQMLWQKEQGHINVSFCSNDSFVKKKNENKKRKGKDKIIFLLEKEMM